MKIPRIKLPDKNLISLREFISGWRVNYHSAGLGRFKLNLGKTTTFPRLTLVRICQQIHSLTSKTNKASKRDLLAWPSCVCQSGCGWGGDVYRGRHWDMAVVLAGDTGPGILMADELSADSPAQPGLDPDTFQAWWCQLAVSPAPRLALLQNYPGVSQGSGPGDKQGDGS